MRKLTILSPALLVIDMQRYFLEPHAPAYLEDGPAIIPSIKKIINKFREEGRPVIFTRHAHKRGESTGQMGKWWNNKLPWDGDEYSELINVLKPRENEPVITKTRYSAFEQTGLNDFLKQRKVDTLAVCGVMTHLCVETTIRHAFMLDYQPILVEDACASENKKHHNAAIYNLKHGFAHVLDTEGMLRCIREMK
jgi:nicotinamidase-related amidase